MTHYQAILEHIQADAPYSYSHVVNWAKSQGFGGTRMIDAIEQMINNRDITIYNDGNTVVVELSETI